jgi:cytochrome c
MDLKHVILRGDSDKLRVKQAPENGFAGRPGKLKKWNKAHPAMDVLDLSPKGFPFKVSGVDFLNDGTLVLAAWEAQGSVYLIKNYDNPAKRSIKRFAWGIHEPLGLKVVDDEIYVVQKQELTKLIDSDKDGVCDFYKNICNAWDVSTNFHEFTFGPVYQNGKFYIALAVAINPGGATTNPQVSDRGCMIEIDPKTGKYKVISENSQWFWRNFRREDLNF